MADISKINLGGTDYNIKDVTARNKMVTGLHDSVDPEGGYCLLVDYADGTQSGELYIPEATTAAQGLMSADDKARLDSLVAASGNGVHFVGTTSTALTDGATTSTLVAASSGSLTKTTGFIAGDLVFYGNKEFIWNGTSWTLFGDLGDLGTLAFKNSAKVTIPATNHTHSTPSLKHTVTQGNVSASGSYTPEGEVNISTYQEAGADVFIGKIGVTGNIARTLVSESQFAGVSITPVGSTVSVNSMKSVGTLPTLGTAFTVPNVTGVGSLPTSEAKSIPNVTSVGKMFAASISGETLTLTAGSAPTLGTAISVNSMKSTGSLPTLGTAFTIPNVTGVGTLPTSEAKTVATKGTAVTVSKLTPVAEDDKVSLGTLIEASFTGTAKNVTVSGKTSGVTVADHAAGTTGAPSGTENKTVTFL